MNTATHFRTGGMGQHPLAAGVVTTVGGGLATTATSAAGTAVLTSIGISAAAVPFIGLAIAGVTVAIAALLNTGCGQTCIETSQWANQAEALLQQNIAAYFQQPAPRSEASQQQCMQNFQQIWNQLVQLCSQPGLGTAGVNCIKDRQDGACHYKAQPPQYPGEPAAGACWNWWGAYYYPIARDPNVAAATAASTATGAVSSLSAATGIDPTMLVLIAGAALALMVIL